jgi:putative phosphoesterase
MPLVLPLQDRYRIGLISDTHGVLPDPARDAFDGADLILHAGDIGAMQILNELETLCRLVAVRGNMDRQPWAENLPEIDSVRAGGFEIRLVHDLAQLRLAAASNDRLAIVSGHTHRPRVERRNGVLYVNPGSAGFPPHGQPASAALLLIEKGHATAEIIDLI